MSQHDLSRIEGDLQVMKKAIGLERPVPPDTPLPHLLLAASGVISILFAWALEAMGSGNFPLLAAIIIGLPPLAAMIAWKQIKARDARFQKTPEMNIRSRREYWWQMVATAGLVATLMASGLSFISMPVILVLLLVLVVAMLNRPIIERREYSSIGWCVGIALLGAWILLGWNVPGPRGAVAGIILILGGLLAAAIGALSPSWRKA